MGKTVDSNLYWRTPKEELPVVLSALAMRSGPVLACAIISYKDSFGKVHRFRDVVKADYSGDGKWHRYLINEVIEVSHWMPMPTLPPEEGDGQ